MDWLFYIIVPAGSLFGAVGAILYQHYTHTKLLRDISIAHTAMTKELVQLSIYVKAGSTPAEAQQLIQQEKTSDAYLENLRNTLQEWKDVAQDAQRAPDTYTDIHGRTFRSDELEVLG